VKGAGIATHLRARLEDSVARGLLLGTIGTVTLNVASVCLNFALVLLLSRQLGVSGYGAYASAFAWAGVLSVVAVLGLTPLVVRHVASYHAFESWGLLRGLLRRSNQSVALASAVTIAVAAGVGWLIYGQEPELLYPFWIALLLVPLIALTSIRQAAMQGLGRVVLGRIPETLVMPALFICLAAAAASALDDDFTAVWATALQVAATLCAFGMGVLLLRRSIPTAVRGATPEYEMASWRRSGLSLVALNVVMAANAQVGTILLGALNGAADAGVFNVASRTTTFISFIMLAATYPLMPLVARLYAAGELRELQHIVVRTARVVLLFAAPTGLVLVIFGPTILSLFGAGFGDGATAVRILAIGELVNVLTGFGGLVLVMTGHEKDLARSVALGAVLNLGLTVLLIPIVGIDGAAIGTATGLVCSNLLMTWLAWRRIGVWPAVVGQGLLLGHRSPPGPGNP
jgi:O-antigen/teichoic acid export membrane protein